jgi:uncharacterized protein
VSPLAITHHADIGRFEAIVDGLRCEADYRLQDGVMVMTHTGVPHALEGRGIAAQLVAAALAHARQQGWRVQPLCSYVAVYMRRHPETQDLLASRG